LKNKINFLKITAWFLLITGIILFIPSWGGTVILIGISILIFLLNYIFKHNSIRFKNYIGLSVWLILGLTTYHLTKKIIIHTSGEPQNIYIVTGIANKPQIHSWWKWKNKIEVDTSYTIYTSTKGNQIELGNVEIYNETGKSIGNRGAGRDISFCGEKKALLNFQTIYLFNRERDSIGLKRGMELRDEQKKRCKNGS